MLGESGTAWAVMAVLTESMAYFGANRRLSPEQVSLLSEELVKRYPHESIADIAVFLRGAVMGQYGEKGHEGETYGALDIPRLLSWFSQYLDQKAQAREQQAREEEAKAEEAGRTLLQLPGIGDMLSTARAANREEVMEQMRGRRIARLMDSFLVMTDDDLRRAWGVHRTAEERSVILQEAIKRKLLPPEFSEHTPAA